MIKLNDIDKKKLLKLFEIRDDNIFLSSLYNEYLYNYSYLNFDSISSNKEFISRFLEFIKLDLKDKKTLNKIKEYKLTEVKELDINDYLNDSYIKNVHPKSKKIESIYLYYKEYNPYEGFIFDETKEGDSYREINSFGYFTSNYSFLSLDKDNKTWMSIIPHEINTMKIDLNKIKGNIVIYGLGLGYFLFHALNKKEINKVVVIEKDSLVINIFNAYLRKYFRNLDKLTILNLDALSFNKKEINKYNFDYCYVDLYHDPIDALKIYINLIKSEAKNITYLYWIENDILIYLRRIIISLFISIYFNEPEFILSEDNFLNSLSLSIKEYLEKKEFNSYLEIYELLKKKVLKD